MGKGVEKVRDFMKKEAVLCIALGLAVLSVFWQPVDKEYMEYIDWNTLMLLFCLMAAMAGFQRLGIFQKTGDFLLGAVKNTRSLLLILCFLPFFFSMLITNDVALITFVPFGMIVLQMCKKRTVCHTAGGAADHCSKHGKQPYAYWKSTEPVFVQPVWCGSG